MQHSLLQVSNMLDRSLGCESAREIVSCRVVCVCVCAHGWQTMWYMFEHVHCPLPFFLCFAATFPYSFVRIYVPFPFWGHITVRPKWNHNRINVKSKWILCDIEVKSKLWKENQNAIKVNIQWTRSDAEGVLQWIKVNSKWTRSDIKESSKWKHCEPKWAQSENHVSS